MKNKLKIRGARQHNLKEVAVDIEKNKLVVITDHQDLESHHWLLIQSTLKDREDMSSLYQRMQDNFLI